MNRRSRLPVRDLAALLSNSMHLIGGASEGIADHLAQTVAELGRLDFWNLGMRPGKQANGFGETDGCAILVLPRNPVAAAAGLAIIGCAIINRGRGRSIDLLFPTLPVAGELQKAVGKTHLVMSRLSVNAATGNSEIEPLHNQSSASYHSLATSEVFVVLQPEQSIVNRGEFAEYVPIWNQELLAK